MKTLFKFLFLMMSMNLFSQTYVLDETFADNGKLYFPGNQFSPEKGVLLNNYYYIISSDKVLKMDYNGAVVSSFGVNGVLSPLPASNYSMLNIKVVNNTIYISGVIIGSNEIQDSFVFKMDDNGNLDNTFGNNGIAVIDFGALEWIHNFIVEPSGKLYCVGTREIDNVALSQRMIYFKMNADGTIDNTFDSNGYKSVQYNLECKGYYITEYDGGYLLVGISTMDNSSLAHPLLLVKVDTDGNLMSDFGTNGSKSVPVSGLVDLDGSERHFFYDGKLYLNDAHAFGFGSLPGSLLIYDVSTNQVVYHYADYSKTSFEVFPDGVFLSGYYSACGGSGVYQCHSKFNLRKKLLDGTTDTNFQNNSVFEYEFPNYVATNNQSRFFVRDNDGKFLIVAYSNMYTSQAIQTQGLSMIRIKEGTLGTADVDYDNNISIYPNPFENEINIKNASSVDKVELFDLYGRKLTTPKSDRSGDDLNFDLSYLPSSTYLLKIYSENSVVSKKIVRK